jgi:hypothetical protein
MRLPIPSKAYDALQETTRNRILEIEDARNRKLGADIELSEDRLILRSPDGSRWVLVVDNTGALSAEAI